MDPIGSEATQLGHSRDAADGREPITAKDTPIIPAVDLGKWLGGGAFGDVYLGRHRTLDVDVAVKLVRGNATALELALSEARFMARLDHPNLVRIHDAGRSGAAIRHIAARLRGR